MEKSNKVSIIYFVSMVCTLLLRIAFSLGLVDGVSDNMADLIFTVISQVLCMGLVPLALYYMMITRKEGRKFRSIFLDFGYKKPNKNEWKNAFILSILMTFLTTFVSMLWQQILRIVGYTSINSSDTIYTGVGMLLWQIVSVGILPAVFEEFTNRGLLYSGYRKKLGQSYIWVSALLFALMHQNITQLLYTFFGGVLMGYLIYYSGSIFTAMLVHFVNNTTAVLRSYGSQHGGFFDIYNQLLMSMMTNIILMILLAFIVWWAVKYTVKTCKKIRHEAEGYRIDPAQDIFELERSRSYEPQADIFDLEHDQTYTNTIDSRAIDIEVEPTKAEAKSAIKNDIFLMATIIMGVLATIATLIWGIMR